MSGTLSVRRLRQIARSPGRAGMGLDRTLPAASQGNSESAAYLIHLSRRGEVDPFERSENGSGVGIPVSPPPEASHFARHFDLPA